MHDKKYRIQKLIKERVAERPWKNQFSANLGLVKPRATIDSSNVKPDERIGIYANCDMKSVMSMGLEDDELSNLVEEMQAILKFLHLMEAAGFRNTSFKFLLIRGSSYIDLPFKFENPWVW